MSSLILLPLSDERDASDVLAYHELRELGVENVFSTVMQDGFCSDSGSGSVSEGSESEESIAY
jgi:hypothetical protein